jgi:mannose-1-phosphate guanylyltransferase
LNDLLEFHLSHPGYGTILVSHVDNPHLYGVVVHDEETKKIHEFKEKPKEHVGNHINAGITVLDADLLNYLELKNLSIGIC